MKKITLLLSAMLMAVMSFAATTVTMDFTSKAGLEKLGIAYPADSTTTEGAYQTELVAGQAYTQEGVSLTATHGSTPTRIWLTAKGVLDLRHYKTGVLTFAAPAGKVILKVKMSGGSVAGFADAPGGLWTGEKSSVALTADASANTIKIKTIEVTYGDAGEDIGNGDNNGDDDNGGTTPPPANPEGVITCAEAVAICEATGSTATTETYTIRGYVTEIKYAYSEQYGTATFWIADTKDGGSVLQAYSCAPLTDADKVFAVGAYVELVGKLKQHNTTNEVEKGTYTVITPADGGTTPPTPPVNPDETTIEIPAEAQGWNIPAEAIDVLQARAICAGLASGATTGTKYYVMGYVKKLHEKYHESGVSGYGNATFYMENVKGAGSMDDFLAFQVYGLDAQKISDPNVVAEGDFVVVYGELTNYGGTYETVGQGAAYIWNSTNSLIAGDPNVVNVEGMQYADASYYTEDEIGYFDFDMYVDIDPDTYEYTYPELYVAVKANSKTALNGTYDLLYAGLWTSANDSVEMGEALGTVTIKNVDTEGNYSFTGSFVGADGKTYKFNDVMYVWGFDYDTEEEIVFSEESTTPPTPPTGGAIVFDADVDQGNATETQAAYEVSKNGVTMVVSSGRLGTFNNEVHYRIYKNQTLTLTSTVGNIVKVEFTTTASDDAEWGPAGWTVTDGSYNYSGNIGTWTGDADSVIFTATQFQVRATQIVVTLASATAVEDVTVGATPVKVIENGQVLIIRGENIYNVLGAQVK